MDTIFKGDLATARGRAVAWIDALFIDHAVFRLVWSNFATVIPGRLYRCNHPTPARLARMVAATALRTLINLRGKTANGSDALSREAARRLGLDFVDMALESRGAPHRDRILRLHAIYRDMRAPALLHCKSGADRAGLAAGLFVLFEGGTAREALRQLSCASATSARPRPASWTPSSCATSARARAANRSWTGCARTTMRPRYAGTSTPTAWPASSTTGFWPTNEKSDG